VRIGVTLTAGLLSAGLLAGVPALAATGHRPGDATPSGGPHRSLHPEGSSGDEPGWTLGELPSYPQRSGATGDRVGWRVAPGVTYTRWTQSDRRGPIVAHLLTVDPRKPGLRIDYASVGTVRRTATVPDILAVDHAVAGVNGDFYDIGVTGAPLGLGKDRQRGLLHARSDGWNNAFYLDHRGRPQIGDLPMHARVVGRPELRITNLNSPFVPRGGIGVYTHRWGKTAGYKVTRGQRANVRAVAVVHGRVTSNRTTLTKDQGVKGLLLVGRGRGAEALRGLRKGARVPVRWGLAGRPQVAISGNHFLVHEGVIKAVDDTEMHPRTAISIDTDTHRVLLLVVDGRSDDSRGYTMVELAELMVDLGADEAVNLDGGGSSTMVAHGPKGLRGKPRVLSTPSDGFLRSVANAVEVTYRAPRPR
jgi:hypothetical protein